MKLVLVFVVGVFAACADKPSEQECQNAHGHLVKLYLDESGAKDVKEPATAKQYKLLAKQTESEFMKVCMETLPGARVRCVVEKKSLSALENCN